MYVSAGAITGNNFYNDTTALKQATEIYRSQVSGATTISQTGLTGTNAVVVTNSGTFNTGTITGSAGTVTSACAGTTADGVEVDGDAASCDAPATATTSTTTTTPSTAEATPTTATGETPAEDAPASSTGGGGINF